MDCIFCKIINGEIPAQIIYEDDKVIAFDDISPKAPHHKLIIPRQHLSTLNDIDDDNKDIVGHMAIVAKKIATDLGVADDGYRVVINCNKEGGQVVFHIHMHLLAGRKMAPSLG